MGQSVAGRFCLFFVSFILAISIASLEAQPSIKHVVSSQECHLYLQNTQYYNSRSLEETISMRRGPSYQSQYIEEGGYGMFDLMKRLGNPVISGDNTEWFNVSLVSNSSIHGYVPSSLLSPSSIACSMEEAIEEGGRIILVHYGNHSIERDILIDTGAGLSIVGQWIESERNLTNRLRSQGERESILSGCRSPIIIHNRNETNLHSPGACSLSSTTTISGISFENGCFISIESNSKCIEISNNMFWTSAYDSCISSFSSSLDSITIESNLFVSREISDERELSLYSSPVIFLSATEQISRTVVSRNVFYGVQGQSALMLSNSRHSLISYNLFHNSSRTVVLAIGTSNAYIGSNVFNECKDSIVIEAGYPSNLPNEELPPIAHSIVVESNRIRCRRGGVLKVVSVGITEFGSTLFSSNTIETESEESAIQVSVKAYTGDMSTVLEGIIVSESQCPSQSSHDCKEKNGFVIRDNIISSASPSSSVLRIAGGMSALLVANNTLSGPGTDTEQRRDCLIVEIDNTEYGPIRNDMYVKVSGNSFSSWRHALSFYNDQEECEKPVSNNTIIMAENNILTGLTGFEICYMTRNTEEDPFETVRFSPSPLLFATQEQETEQVYHSSSIENMGETIQSAASSSGKEAVCVFESPEQERAGFFSGYTIIIVIIFGVIILACFHSEKPEYPRAEDRKGAERRSLIRKKSKKN